jgi:hypothetical protein
LGLEREEVAQGAEKREASEELRKPGWLPPHDRGNASAHKYDIDFDMNIELICEGFNAEITLMEGRKRQITNRPRVSSGR